MNAEHREALIEALESLVEAAHPFEGAPDGNGNRRYELSYTVAQMRRLDAALDAARGVLAAVWRAA